MEILRVSFNSKDGVNVVSGGDSIKECIALADVCEKVVAVGINCTSPRFMEGLVLEIGKVLHAFVLYPTHWVNLFLKKALHITLMS